MELNIEQMVTTVTGALGLKEFRLYVKYWGDLLI